MINKSAHGDQWKVEAIQKSPDTFMNRKPFPEAWRGLLNNDVKFKELTGIEDILFCHKSGFLAVLGSRDSALKLAELALSDRALTNGLEPSA